MGIYGEGVTQSPHFLGRKLSLLELFREHPAILGPHDLAALMKTGEIRYDGALGKLVETPQKVAAVPEKAKKKRAKKK